MQHNDMQEAYNQGWNLGFHPDDPHYSVPAPAHPVLAFEFEEGLADGREARARHNLFAQGSLI